MKQERATIQVASKLKKKLKVEASKSDKSIGKLVQFLFDVYKKKK